MRQFSLCTALLIMAIFAFGFVGVERYRAYHEDFSWPSDATLLASSRALTPPELEVLVSAGGDGHSANLRASHLPRGAEYWKLKAKAIKPGMTEFALKRQNFS